MLYLCMKGRLSREVAPDVRSSIERVAQGAAGKVQEAALRMWNNKDFINGAFILGATEAGVGKGLLLPFPFAYKAVLAVAGLVAAGYLLETWLIPEGGLVEAKEGRARALYVSTLALLAGASAMLGVLDFPNHPTRAAALMLLSASALSGTGLKIDRFLKTLRSRENTQGS